MNPHPSDRAVADLIRHARLGAATNRYPGRTRTVGAYAMRQCSAGRLVRRQPVPTKAFPRSLRGPAEKSSPPSWNAAGWSRQQKKTTKLAGPVKRTYYDTYARYIVGVHVLTRETGPLAEEMAREVFGIHTIPQVVHADRGTYLDDLDARSHAAGRSGGQAISLTAEGL